MPREVSNRPQAVRKRLRTASNGLPDRLDAVKEDLETLYQKPIEEWDFEELQRGRPRKPNGRFPRNKPEWLTPVMRIEAQRRLETMTHEQLSRYAGNAIEVMADLMNNARVEIVRFQASKYIIDQLIGLPTARIKVEANVKFENLLADVMENHDGGKTGDVIDLDESEWEVGELGGSE